MVNQKKYALEREPNKPKMMQRFVSGACCDKRANHKLLRIQRRIAALLNVPSNYHILLFDLNQVSAFDFFACLKLKENTRCGFLDTGARSSSAIMKAKKSHEVEIVGSSKMSNYCYVAKADWIPFNLSFLHLTSTNETEGNRNTKFPKIVTPQLLDMSSDLFSTKVHINHFSMIYALGDNQIIPQNLCLIIIQNRYLADVGHQLLTHPCLLGTCGQFAPGIFKSLFLFDHFLCELEKSEGVRGYRERFETLSKKLYKEIERNTKFCCLVNPEDRAVIAIRFTVKKGDDKLPFALHLDANDSNVVIWNAQGDFVVLLEKFPEKEIIKLIGLMQDFELK